MIAEVPEESLPKVAHSVPELVEPLNLSIRSGGDVKVRTKTLKGGLTTRYQRKTERVCGCGRQTATNKEYLRFWAFVVYARFL